MSMQDNLIKVQEANRRKAQNQDQVVQLLREISDKLDKIITNQKNNQ